jgi:shikimate dehydrogenase
MARELDETDVAGGLPPPISGETRLYMIVGDPIAQAGSPALFNAVFRRRNLPAVLVPAHVEGPSLPRFLRGLRGLKNLDGLVITVPHKIAAMDCVDRIGENGRKVGSINAIRCQADGTWAGDNFDGLGCIAGLRAAGHELRGRHLLLLGAGGAGRAVAHAFADAGAARVWVFDPDAGRCAYLADALRAAHPGLLVETGSPDPRGFDTVANCTPLGMKTQDALPVDVDRIAPGTLVVELVLRPATTRLLQVCAARGCAVQPGLGTLQGQVELILDFVGHEATGTRLSPQ